MLWCSGWLLGWPNLIEPAVYHRNMILWPLDTAFFIHFIIKQMSIHKSDQLFSTSCMICGIICCTIFLNKYLGLAVCSNGPQQAQKDSEDTNMYHLGTNMCTFGTNTMYLQGTKMHILGVNMVQKCTIWQGTLPVTTFVLFSEIECRLLVLVH